MGQGFTRWVLPCTLVSLLVGGVVGGESDARVMFEWCLDSCMWVVVVVMAVVVDVLVTTVLNVLSKPGRTMTGSLCCSDCV